MIVSWTFTIPYTKLCYGTQQKVINSVWKPNQLDFGLGIGRFVKCIFVTKRKWFFYHWQTLWWSRICWWSSPSPHVILTYQCVLTHSYVFRNCYFLWLGFDPFQNTIAQHTWMVQKFRFYINVAKETLVLSNSQAMF
jgi:hypothetical protein